MSPDNMQPHSYTMNVTCVQEASTWLLGQDAGGVETVATALEEYKLAAQTVQLAKQFQLVRDLT